jgi:hypothetical protein
VINEYINLHILQLKTQTLQPESHKSIKKKKRISHAYGSAQRTSPRPPILPGTATSRLKILNHNKKEQQKKKKKNYVCCGLL